MKVEAEDSETEMKVEPEEGIGGKARAKAKSKGKAKAKARVRADRNCLARACDKLRYSGHRWCKDHKRCAESMKLQAQAADDQGEEGAVEAYEKVFSTDETAAEAMEAWCEINPPEHKWQRKQFLDWAQFVVQHGKRSSVIDRSKTKPMTEGEFLKWMKDNKAI